MSVVVLQGEGRSLTVRADALAVQLGTDVIAARAPEQVEEVHVYGDAQITPAARHLCLLRGVDFVFFTRRGRFLGRLTSRDSAAGDRRLAQVRAVDDRARRLAVARAVVAGKIANQETHLRRVQRRTGHEDVSDALVGVRAARERVPGIGDLDVLRGAEGMAAKLYFGALRVGCTNPLFTFAGRTRRPPTDPINAALSFAYTLMVGQVESAVRGAGLDVYVGFLHEATRGNPALALDLAEEWRPLVDAMIFGLFNRRELAPEDFEVPGARFTGELTPAEAAGPAVHLAAVGREVVFRTWFRRLEEAAMHEGAGGRLTMADAIRWQAAHLARVVEGRDAAYAPVKWT